MVERRIFVTGGSSGLGKELVLQSLNRNLSSFFHQRTNSTSELGVEFVYGDIKDLKTQDDIINFVKEKNINVFINNAAIYSNKSIKDVTYNEINELISVNLLSPLFLTKRVLDIFSEQGQGMVYNINSLAGINGSKNESIYCTTKHGLKGLTDSLKYEYKGQKNIRIVNVTLGAFKSKMTIERDTYPLLGETCDVANCILDHICQNYNSISSDLIITRNS